MYKFEPHCDDVNCPIREKCIHFAEIRITSFPFEIFSTKLDGTHKCRVGSDCKCFKPSPN